MNIYFSCSITGGRRDQATYRAIVDGLKMDGHDVPTAVLADEQILEDERSVDPAEVYRRDIAWLDGCDAVVAEVSTPSHGVGYEIAYALQRGKPVICGHRQGIAVSKMLTGNTHPGIQVVEYPDVESFLGTVRTLLEALSS